MQNFNELDKKKISDCKALAFEVWGLKTSLGKFGPKPFAKDLESHQMGTLDSIFRNKTSLFQEL